MKKQIILWFMLIPTALFSQNHSWDGNGLSPTAKIGCLNIFVNIIYDIHPDTNVFNNNNYWPRITDTTLEGINNTAIPIFLLDWMDTMYVPGQLHGTCTRIFGESSFDSLQITGDFMVVNIKESTICQHGQFTEGHVVLAVFDFIRKKGFSTIYGHDDIANYDYNGDNKVDFVNVLYRNLTKNYGDLNPGSGYSGIYGSLYINGILYYCGQGTRQCVGDGDFYRNPTDVVIHEISHKLFGYNNFHTSGGNHRGSLEIMPFLNVQGGYGLMGAAGSSLVSCNGYERWRMHWKHPQSVDYISAQDNTGFITIAADITKEDGNKSFVLRDFVTYGDAIRIKLPYKDNETSSNQYIWLENHQIRNDKLDFLQYSNTYACRSHGIKGVYAYYQIGRDILEGTVGEIWDNYHRDNLKIIPAEGYYDYICEEDTYNLECVSYENHYYTLRRGIPNSFCGGQDQEVLFFPQETDSQLYLSRGKSMWRKSVNDWNDDQLACIGDSLDAFVPPIKINMGTNPSTCNAKTYHSTNSNNSPSGYIVPSAIEKNTQTTYLTGLSIEMLRKDRVSILVNIRWDDYEITNNTRWTGKIVLKDTAILTTPYSITLAQNKTVALPYRDAETGLFAGRTQWTCEPGSYFRQNDSTHVYLTENSSLFFQDGSTYEQAESAVMHVQSGCTLQIQIGANVRFLGTLDIDSGAVVTIKGTTAFGSTARLIVRPGGKLVVDGGTITSAGAGEMWQGIEVVGDRTKHQEPQYQGVVDLRNGAVIENAVTAIRTGIEDDNWYTTGGIIMADDAIFRNNQRAIEFLSYNDTISASNILDNCSYFTRCTYIGPKLNRVKKKDLILQHETTEKHGKKYDNETTSLVSNDIFFLYFSAGSG